MARVSSHSLITTLGKSNLLTAEQIAAAQELVAAGGEMEDGRNLAKELVRRKWITRWQAKQLLAGQSTFFLGKYKLLDQIGRGGMGAVFRAEHTVMGRVVAIKIMARSLVDKPEAVARFRREVESVARLNHPNIVAAYDADAVGSVHFLVMEYVPGRDLKYWLQKYAPLPVAWVCECMRQAALGLEHAHEHGLVHRDIKPGNLLVVAKDVDSPPRLKILDMGLARLADQAQAGDVTQSGVVVGTPDYISPEQADETRQVDIRSDIFGLGCTAFNLLTGQLPFGGDSMMAKLLARVRTDAPPVRRYRRDVPAGLEVVVAKMLAREADDRYQTPAEVANALRPFCDKSYSEEDVLFDPPGELPSPSTLSSISDSGGGPPDSSLNEFLNALADRVDGETPMADGSDTIRTQLDPQKLKDQEGDHATPSSGVWRRKKFPLPAIVGVTSGVLLVILLLSLLFWPRGDVEPTNAAKDDSGEIGDFGEFGDPKKEKDAGKKQPKKKKKKTPRKVVQHAPPTTVTLKPGEKVDVLAKVDIKRDVIRGDWEKQNDRLVVPNDPNDPLLQLPLAPTGDYELTVVAQREIGLGSLSIGLPVGSSQVRLLLEGSSGANPGLGTALSGLGQVDQKSAKDNMTTLKTSVLHDDQPNTIVCTVRQNYVRVACNGVTIIRWRGDAKKLLSLPEEFAEVAPKSLFLSGNSARFLISRVELNVPEPPGPSQPLPDKPLNYFEHLDAIAGAVRGAWSIRGDRLWIPKADGGALLQLPHAPPEEYDVTLVAERTDSHKGFLVVGLMVGGRQTMAVIDWKGTTSGLHLLDGKAFSVPPLATGSTVFPVNKPATVVISVRKTRVHVAVDGKRLFDWHGPPSRLSLDPKWAVPDKSSLFLGSENTRFEVTKLELRLPKSDPEIVSRELIVGTGPREFDNLDAAIAKAAPGDTILIRHRGPLEFSPAKLAGRTPLTIVGDTNDQVDFWPILRQVRGPNKADPGQQPALFQADDLKLTLRKVHLAIGGPRRDSLGAVFSLRTGRIELDECSLTVGISDAFPEPATEPIALVAATPAEADNVEVVLTRSFFRGVRLQNCVRAQGAGTVRVQATGTTWAGGAAPWVHLADFAGTLQLEATGSTLCNLSNLIHWRSTGGAAPKKMALQVQATKTVFAGPFANQEPLIAWNRAETNFAAAAADKRVIWAGSGNNFDQFGGFYKEADGKTATLTDWHALWAQPRATRAHEIDPMFRVRPEGVELQETTARDLQPRFERVRTSIDTRGLGADPRQQPHAPAAIFHRPTVAGEAAATPRGRPRVRIVHQRKGPFKTLEAAFQGLEDGDIIEIADSADYTPSRNFSVSPSAAVLSSTVPRLTIRAAEGADPVIILRHDAQKGFAGGANKLYLFASDRVSGSTLMLQGLHFRKLSSQEAPTGVSLSAPVGVALLRVTNCTFADPTPKGRCHVMTYHVGGMQWFENCVYYHGQVPEEQNSPEFLYVTGPRNNAVTARNCIFDGNFSHWKNLVSARMLWSLDRNSFSRPVAHLTPEAFPYSITSHDNLMVCLIGVVQSEPVALSKGTYHGGHNALWVGPPSSRPLTAKGRGDGPNHWFPGEVLKTFPPVVGRATQRTPYNRYKLRGNHPAARMARDGGPAGARIEYLPNLPSMPSSFYK